MSYDSQTAILNRHSFTNSFTTEFDTDQTGVTLMTPTSGKYLKITGAYINSEASSGYVRIYFSDDENDQVNTVIKTFAATSPTTGYVPLVINGDRDAVLKVDSTLGADQNYFMLINYSEV